MAWLDPWGIRQKVKVTNNTGRYLYNYQILIELTSSNFDFENCKSDGSDIRFTESDGVTKLPYWIEEWDSEERHARVWVRIFSLSPLESYIFLYYSNPEAESESNGKLTFKFFEGFEDGNVDNWTQTNTSTGELSVQDDEVESGNYAGQWFWKTSGTAYAYLPIPELRDKDLVIEFSRKGGGSSGQKYTVVGLDKTAEDGANGIKLYFNHKYQKFEYYDGNMHTIMGIPEPRWYRFKIKVYSDGSDTKFDLWVNGTKRVEGGGTRGNIDSVRLFQFQMSTGHSGWAREYIDNILVRKFVEPEPTIELGEVVDVKKYVINFEFEVNSLLEGRQGGKNSLYAQESISSIMSSSFLCSTEFFQNIDSEIESIFRFSPLPPPPYPYTYKFPIFIENNTTSTLYDFQIPVEINSSNFDYSCCNEYGSDINFYDDDYSQELPFWWEKWNYNGTSKVWIKVPEIPPGFHLCVILVCGHSQWEYVRPEQPKEVFLFYDGFERSDVSSWTFEFSPSDSGEPYYGVADACHGDYELKAGFKENCENPHVTVKQTVSLPSGEKVLNCWQKETNTGVSPTHAIYINGTEKWSDVADSEYEDCVHVQTDSFTDSGNVEIKFTDSKDTNTKVGIRLDSIFIRKYAEPSPTATLIGKESIIYQVSSNIEPNISFSLIDLKKNNTLMLGETLEFSPPVQINSFNSSQNVLIPISSYIPAYIESNNFSLIPASWKRKRNIIIENDADQTLTDYQICLVLTPENFDYENCKSDGGDLRFKSLSLSSLPYWIERWEYHGTSKIWVRVDEIPVGSNVCLYMFYDNPLATSESDIKATFILGDDFADDSFWSSSHPSKMYIADDLLHFSVFENSEYQAYLNTKEDLDLPDSFFIQFRCKIKFLRNSYSIFYVGVSDAIPNVENLVAFQPYWNDYAYYLSVKEDGETSKDKMYAPGGDDAKLHEMFWDDCWHGVRIWKEGGTIHGEIWNGDFTEQIGYVEPGGEREGRITNVNPSSLKKFIILNRASSPNDKEFGYEGCLDDLMVAKYATPEPVVTLGESQYVIIHDSYCYSESKTDFRLNSSYLIGETFSLLPLSLSVGSLFTHYHPKLEIEPNIDGFSVPVLEYLLYANVSMEESDILKKFWVWESLLQSVDISSLFSINLNPSLLLEPEPMGALCTHWLINGGNVPNLISYKVTQEWAAPDTAEVRFKGLPKFLTGDLIHIVYDTGNPDYPLVTLFKGPVLSMDRELVKGREETIVRAVSNEWYLTKQNCFWDEESCLNTLDPIFRLQDIIYMWLGSWDKEMCCDDECPDVFKCVCEKWREKYTHGISTCSYDGPSCWWFWWYLGVGAWWKETTGLFPMYIEDMPDWGEKYVMSAGKSGFNFFYGTTKWDAIMQICNVCDYVFYCMYWDYDCPSSKYPSQTDWGRRLAVFISRETCENDLMLDTWGEGRTLCHRYCYEFPSQLYGYIYWDRVPNPLARSFVLEINDDPEDGNFKSKLISVKTREEQSAEDTKINRLAVTCQDFPVVTVEQRENNAKPVEEYIAISNVDIDDLSDLQQFAEKRLEELRLPDVTFEARFLDLVLTKKTVHREGPGTVPLPIHTGMYINFEGINGLPPSSDEDGYYRIMKITYELGEQTGGRLITTLECRDTDIIHPGSPKLNEIENIMHREAKKIEKGPILPGHPCPSNPRPPMLGEIPWIEIGEIVNYNAEEQTVDVKIYRTGQIVKGIPLL